MDGWRAVAKTWVGRRTEGMRLRMEQMELRMELRRPKEGFP
jgi:hypothetical protein